MRCIFNDLRECVAKIPAACHCQAMHLELYLEAVDKMWKHQTAIAAPGIGEAVQEGK